MLEATTATEILDVLELIDEFGIKLIIQDAVEAWVVAEEIGKRDVALVITPRQKHVTIKE